ncbi:MAG: S8/S53 family peptidase [Actinomycetes bacterium]
MFKSRFRSLWVGGLLVTTLVSGVALVPVHADVPPSIAVIDTGTNPALFKDSLVAEACFVEYATCPNGKRSMEGVGASALPITKINASMSHGTQMLSIVHKVAPSAKIVMVRIVGLTDLGNPYIYSLDAVKQGLDWVIANRVKYNITVVSISQGKVFDNCKVPAGMAAQVATLKAAQVPVISATGNNSNRSAIFSPACLPDVVSVGATDNPWGGMEAFAWDPAATPYIARYSNGSPDTDFYANGRWFVTNLDGSTKFMVGTSNATASISGLWLVNRKSSFDATYAGIAATSTVAKNEWLTGRYVFINS